MHPHAKHLQELMQTRADLHPDLVPYLERAQRSGAIMLRHPLVYEMFYMPSLNALINHRYEMKMHSITEARERLPSHRGPAREAVQNASTHRVY